MVSCLYTTLAVHNKDYRTIPSYASRDNHMSDSGDGVCAYDDDALPPSKLKAEIQLVGAQAKASFSMRFS